MPLVHFVGSSIQMFVRAYLALSLTVKPGAYIAVLPGISWCRAEIDNSNFPGKHLMRRWDIVGACTSWSTAIVTSPGERDKLHVVAEYTPRFRMEVLDNPPLSLDAS